MDKASSPTRRFGVVPDFPDAAADGRFQSVLPLAFAAMNLSGTRREPLHRFDDSSTGVAGRPLVIAA